jgi:glycosyltransferase involved in cell wall biosynthesis
MISVVILTKNSEKYLADVLQAISHFQEVVVFDTGSTDTTIQIAKRFANVSVHEGAFKGFGKTRNEAALCAKNDWILAIDSDEIASPELVGEILSLPLQPKTVYSFWRKNFFRGKFIKGCSWYPDRQIRLYHRGDTQFSAALVHESVVVGTNRHVELNGYVVHYPYATIGDFLAKMQSYSTLFANEWRGKKKGGLAPALSHGLWSFFI